jgi:DMSO reductase anchor subunit
LKRAAKRVLFGSRGGISGSVYGTILVMAALTAGSDGDSGLWQLAAIVAASVVVIWIAHVYAHGLAESIDLGRRLDTPELRKTGLSH